MIDARHFFSIETLRDGTVIQIRSLRPDDGELMAEAFAKLEQDSIQKRFFGAKSGLTPADHLIIRELDFDSRVILVATSTESGREMIIASSSYSRVGPDSAEVAFVVEEDFHGKGIARHLLCYLGQIARERGIVRFEAEVLPHNVAMLRVFSRCGWSMTRSRRNGVIHVTLDLSGETVG
jgi:RimJ/RimL family protein N-acetyltransferase